MNNNIYKLFLNFLKFEDYPIDDSEDTKNKLFKLNNYSCWLEHYIQIQVYNLKYTKRDIDEDNIDYWYDTVNNIFKWDIEYKDENIFYSNGCKYERIKPESSQKSRCTYCSCMPLGDDFPCNVMSCETDYVFKLIPTEKLKEENSNKAGRKFDSDKLRYDLIPPIVDEELAKILTYGVKKYEENNWQQLDNFNNRYYAALRRHVEAWRNGEDLDKESGEHHLSHALTNLAFLVWNNVKKEE